MSFDRCAPAARRFLLWLALALVLVSARGAHAHTGEYLRGLALHPTNTQLFALRYEGALGGILFSRDGGKSMQIVPGQSFYLYPLRRQVPMLMAADGKLQLALDDELRVDDGTGCNLTHVEPSVDKSWITALAPHPSDPSTTFLLMTADGQPRHAGLWRRDGQGVLTPLGTSDIGAGATLGALPYRPTSLKVIPRAASEGGLRFVEAGLVEDEAMPSFANPVLRISDDLGKNWTTRAIPDPDPTSGMPELLVVSASEPFQALVAIERGLGEDDDDPNDPIYLTKDGGQTFTTYLNQIQVSGEALLLPSGQILLGDRGTLGGLWSAASFDSAPRKIQDFRVHCLAYQPATQKTFLCTRHDLGVYDVANDAFCVLFHMTDTNAVVSCPAAPIEQNAKAMQQLCDGYCSAQHYASSPLCTTFPVPSNSLCGLSARAYDAQAGYLPPVTAGPRCAGFPEQKPDAGLPNADAGEAAFADAGDAGASDPEDEATGDEADTSDVDNEDEAESDDEPEDDDEANGDDEMGKRKKRRGCHCALADAGHERAPLAVSFAFALAFYLRRRLRAAR